MKSLVNGNSKLFLLTSTRSSLLVNTQFSSGKVSQRLWNVVVLSLQIEHTQAVHGGDEGGALGVVTMKNKEMECTWSMKLCPNRQTREKHQVPRSYESGILDNIAASADFMTWDGMWVNMRAASCWLALPEVEHFTLWGSIAKLTPTLYMQHMNVRVEMADEMVIPPILTCWLQAKSSEACGLSWTEELTGWPWGRRSSSTGDNAVKENSKQLQPSLPKKPYNSREHQVDYFYNSQPAVLNWWAAALRAF